MIGADVADRAPPAARRRAPASAAASTPSSRPGCSSTSTAPAASSAACTGGRTIPSAPPRTGARAPSASARAEERLARSSDLVVAVNEGAVDALAASAACRPRYLPNGCDAPYFAGVDDGRAARPTSTCRGPIAGFVGHINSRTDLALLEAVADAGISLLLIGPKDPAFEPARFDRLVERDNVALSRPAPVRAAAVVLEADRRRPRALRRHRVQPLQLPDEDARVPRRRAAGRRDVAAGDALARHRPRDARGHSGRLRRAVAARRAAGARPRARAPPPRVRRRPQLGEPGGGRFAGLLGVPAFAAHRLDGVL